MPRTGTSAGGDKYPRHGPTEAVATHYQEANRDLVKLAKAKAMENPQGSCALAHSVVSCAIQVYNIILSGCEL